MKTASHLHECTTSEELQEFLGNVDSVQGDLDEDELRATLERVHRMPPHPKTRLVFEKALESGHRSGYQTVGSHYADIVSWLMIDLHEQEPADGA